MIYRLRQAGDFFIQFVWFFLTIIVVARLAWFCMSSKLDHYNFSLVSDPDFGLRTDDIRLGYSFPAFPASLPLVIFNFLYLVNFSYFSNTRKNVPPFRRMRRSRLRLDFL